MERCPTCVILQAENRRLQAKIGRLEAEVKRLQRIIREGQQEAAGIISQADEILSQHQPRGRWSFAKGAKRATEAILNRLK